MEILQGRNLLLSAPPPPAPMRRQHRLCLKRMLSSQLHLRLRDLLSFLAWGKAAEQADQLLRAAGIAVRGVSPDAARGFGIETEMEGTFGRVGTAAAASAKPELARSRSGAASGPSYPIWQVGAGVDPPVAGHSRTPSRASKRGRAQSKRGEPCLEIHTIFYGLKPRVQLRLITGTETVASHVHCTGAGPRELEATPLICGRPTILKRQKETN